MGVGASKETNERTNERIQKGKGKGCLVPCRSSIVVVVVPFVSYRFDSSSSKAEAKAFLLLLFFFVVGLWPTKPLRFLNFHTSNLNCS